MDTSKAKDRIGQTRLNKQGEKMTVVAYTNANDATVQFADGTTRTHVKYRYFINGTVPSPAQQDLMEKQKALHKKERRSARAKSPTAKKKLRVGLSAKMHNGRIVTIIEYTDSHHVLMRDDEGNEAVREYRSFRDRTVNLCNNKHIKKNSKDRVVQRVGNTVTAVCGLKMRIISISKDKQNTKRCVVEFEDGTVCKNVRMAGFAQKRVGHPSLSQHVKYKRKMFGQYYVQKCMFIANQTPYYLVCDRVGREMILSPHMMMERSGIKTVF